MSGYADFADFYDRFTENVDYAALADYLLTLFERHGSRPHTLLDIACGSGSLCVELVKRGVDCIGVDSSSAMLMKAAQKLPDTLFLQQDMTDFELYGTVDGAVCTLDSINHLRKTADVRALFTRTRLFIEPQGLFIFDMNTPYKHREVLGDTAWVMEQDGILCAWRNRYLPRTCEVDIWLDFFAETPAGTYRRVSETVRERAYSLSTITRLLKETGFTLLACYHEGSSNPPAADSERVVVVARSTRTIEQAQNGE